MNWRDILIHAAIGVAAGFMAFLFWWPLLLINAAFWIVREVWQRIEKAQPMGHMLSPQVLMEWAVPALAASAVYFLLGL